MNRAQDTESRPYLLPLLKGNITRSKLGYFHTNLLPLAQQVLTRSRQCQNQKKPVEAQNYHLIYLQLWALFPGFCSLPTDVKVTFPLMAKDLGVLVNGNPELRPTVCSGLNTLIEKFFDVQENPEATPEEKGLATESLEAVGKFAKNFLPILFNTYSSLKPQTRGYVLELVRSYLKITDAEVGLQIFFCFLFFFGEQMKKLIPSSICHFSL